MSRFRALDLQRERDQRESDIQLTMEELARKHLAAVERAEKLTGRLRAVQRFKRAVHGEMKPDGLGTLRLDLIAQITACGNDVATLAASGVRKTVGCYNLYEVVGRFDALWQLQSG